MDLFYKFLITSHLHEGSQTRFELVRKYLKNMARFLLCSGGLNSILGFGFPLFSMFFPGKSPSGWKTMEVGGSKSVVFCGRSTYKVSMCFEDSLPFHGDVEIPSLMRSRWWLPVLRTPCVFF
jgi:hypothetical protein